MIDAFNSFEWHDAVLLQVNIDRSDPGKNDEVLISVRWVDGTQQQIRFTDCYALEAQMNFGVVASESILSASCVGESCRLKDIRQRWTRVGVSLDKLYEFEITTSSTGSTLRICALEFHVVSST